MFPFFAPGSSRRCATEGCLNTVFGDQETCSACSLREANERAKAEAARQAIPGRFEQMGFSTEQALELAVAGAKPETVRGWLRDGATHEQIVRIAC